ncbi:HIT family protein [Eubacterium xylanophilum]|uniref:HIT family protein n=1 Tax=Eubacterium xylanophilum TaxID=39497 RepID=UPI00047AF4DC|nr:HIT family protein [Eubacterium xylanophilum]MCR5798195.1 HIT family protein [Eubacterium sp.]
MDNCIFCKILKGEIPSTSVYEDDDFRAILDVSPASTGHVIILPKKHAANIFELDDEIAGKIMPVAKKIAAALKKTYNCDGINILQNNGEAAGQTVFHLHVHVIPRFNGDTINIKWTPGEMPDMEKVANEIKANL